METSDILAERQKTHGDFSLNSQVSQEIKAAIRETAGASLSPMQLEALDYIAGKIGRICSGNPNEPDHWRDIAGYATLVVDRLPTVGDHPELPLGGGDERPLNPGWKYAERDLHTITEYDIWVMGDGILTLQPVSAQEIGSVYMSHLPLVTPVWHNPAGIDTPGEGFRFCVVGETRKIAYAAYDTTGYWKPLRHKSVRESLLEGVTYNTHSSKPLPPVFRS